MGHNSAISSHPISTSFLQIDGWSMDLQVLGCHTCTPHSWHQSTFENQSFVLLDGIIFHDTDFILILLEKNYIII